MRGGASVCMERGISARKSFGHVLPDVCRQCIGIVPNTLRIPCSACPGRIYKAPNKIIVEVSLRIAAAVGSFYVPAEARYWALPTIWLAVVAFRNLPASTKTLVYGMVLS